jgi:agmatinase
MTSDHRPRPRLIGVPYDLGSSHLRGPAEAPPLIRAALRSPAGNSWTEQLRDLDAPDGLTDAGDLSLPDGRQVRATIETAIRTLVGDGWRPLVLGGDHSITYPVLRAVRGFHQRLTILHVDAHPDLYDEFEGDRFSHACPFARIMEERLADRLVQVGIRTLNGHQRDQATRFDVEIFDMRSWAAGERPALDGPVYVSMDVDALDPAHAPGVSHREPGGLTVRDVLTLIQEFRGTLVGADVVEYNPRQDVSDLTAVAAAKLVKELAGRMLVDG